MFYGDFTIIVIDSSSNMCEYIVSYTLALYGTISILATNELNKLHSLLQDRSLNNVYKSLNSSIFNLKKKFGKCLIDVGKINGIYVVAIKEEDDITKLLNMKSFDNHDLEEILKIIMEQSILLKDNNFGDICRVLLASYALNIVYNLEPKLKDYNKYILYYPPNRLVRFIEKTMKNIVLKNKG